jgi:predicted pyridoxine 5'-phosphate oxidase superfamily flavin-nucleotide-binding protein
MDAGFYHAGSRALQDRFGSRRLADRLAEVTLRRAFGDGDRAFIEGAGFFFLATADAEGRPDCSFKGGLPGFVRVTGPDELAFPDYDGNGMFRSLGNLLANRAVGLLFIDMGAAPRRLRVNGTTTVAPDDPLLGAMAGAQLVVRVRARAIFPNCPRYIPGPDGPSVYAPRPDTAPVEPAWKGFPEFRDVVPPERSRQSERRKDRGGIPQAGGLAIRGNRRLGWVKSPTLRLLRLLAL